MKELGYGKGYRYDPEEENGVSDQTYLPKQVEGSASTSLALLASRRP